MLVPPSIETVDGEKHILRGCCYACRIKVGRVLCGPFGVDISQWERFTRLSGNLERKTNRGEAHDPKLQST